MPRVTSIIVKVLLLSAITALVFSSCNVSRKGGSRKGEKARTEKAGGETALETDGAGAPEKVISDGTGSWTEGLADGPDEVVADGGGQPEESGPLDTGDDSAEPDSRPYGGDDAGDDEEIPWDDEPEPAPTGDPDRTADPLDSPDGTDKIPADPLTAPEEGSETLPNDDLLLDGEAPDDDPLANPSDSIPVSPTPTLPAAPADSLSRTSQSESPEADGEDSEDFIDVDMEESTAGTFGEGGDESGGNMKVVDFEADIMRPINITEDSTALNLLGNVVFYHNGSVITCDSAVRYSEKRMDCFKRVVINNGTTYVYGDRAEYNGETNTARVYAPIVKMVDEDAVLYTYRFIFNTLTNVGRYGGGGVLTQNDNHMESERGYYNTDTREFTGAGAVELINPDYKLVSDSVRYNLDTEVAEFFTPTQIWNEKGEILLADRGIYRNATSDYEFTSNSYILTDNQEIWADTLIHNSLDDYTELRRDIQIIDEENNSMAFGDYGEYWGETEQGMLTLEPSLVSFDPESPADTLYMRSDSMFFYTYDYDVDFFREEESRLPEGESPMEELISGPGGYAGSAEEQEIHDSGPVRDEELLLSGDGLPELVENPDGVGTKYELIVPPDEPGEPFEDDDLDRLTESGEVEAGQLMEAAEELEFKQDSRRNRRRDRTERQSRQQRRDTDADARTEAGTGEDGGYEVETDGYDAAPVGRAAESDGGDHLRTGMAVPGEPGGDSGSADGQDIDEISPTGGYKEPVDGDSVLSPGPHPDSGDGQESVRPEEGATPDGDRSEGDTSDGEQNGRTYADGAQDGGEVADNQVTVTTEPYVSPYAELSAILYGAIMDDSVAAELSPARFWLQVREEIGGDSLKREYYTTAVEEALAVNAVDTAVVSVPSRNAEEILSTLISESEAEERSLLALQSEGPQDSLQRVFYGYRNVRIYRDDFQAVCDSIVGFSKDSTLHLQIDPVMWTDQNQVVSDLMVIFTRDEQLYKAEFTGNPFMSSQVDEQRFNQIKGKFMVSWFRDNDIYHHDVFGNGQTYYYMEDDKTGDIDGFMTCECADITFFIEESQIDEIIYRLDPVYWIYPIDKIPADVDEFLPGFKWEAHRRPMSRQDVHTRDIRPRRREEILAVPHPEFPITAELDATRERLIRQNLWRDRNDRLSPQALEFMRYVDLRDAEQALDETGQ